MISKSDKYNPLFPTKIQNLINKKVGRKSGKEIKFCQEYYYRKIWMGTVIFTKVGGHEKSQSLRTFWVLGVSDFISPWTYAKTSGGGEYIEKSKVKWQTIL